MPTVTAVSDVAAPLDRVYAIARDIEAFPEFMPDVQEVKILEQRPDGYQSSAWVGIVREFKRTIQWTEEDHWDDANHTCAFKQIQGDYDKLEGTWSFQEENGGTRFNSFLEYEYVVPTLGPLVGKVIYSIVVKNVENILEAIKMRSEK